MRILILEDNEERNTYFTKHLRADHDFTIATTSDEMIKLLKENKKIDILFLDHDLGGEEMVDSHYKNTGYQVTKWLLASQFRPKIGCAVVHSCNPVGAENMLGILNQINIDSYQIPFPSLDLPGLLPFLVLAATND